MLTTDGCAVKKRRFCFISDSGSQKVDKTHDDVLAVVELLSKSDENNQIVSIFAHSFLVPETCDYRLY